MGMGRVSMERPTELPIPSRVCQLAAAGSLAVQTNNSSHSCWLLSSVASPEATSLQGDFSKEGTIFLLLGFSLSKIPHLVHLCLHHHGVVSQLTLNVFMAFLILQNHVGKNSQEDIKPVSHCPTSLHAAGTSAAQGPA